MHRVFVLVIVVLATIVAAFVSNILGHSLLYAPEFHVALPLSMIQSKLSSTIVSHGSSLSHQLAVERNVLSSTNVSQHPFGTMQVNGLSKICGVQAKSILSLHLHIPIFLIAKERIRSLQLMIDSIYLLTSSFEVIILDQGSTYPPMLRFLKSVGRNYINMSVVIQKSNDMHGLENNVAAAVASYRKNHPEVEFYVVSDADLSLRGCEHDILPFFAACLNACPHVVQIGTSLRIDNIQQSSSLKMGTKNIKTADWELQFWDARKHMIAEWDNGRGNSHFVNLFEAAIDTTFAMRRMHSQFKRLQRPCIRAGAPYMSEHIPWYSLKPSPDESWYMQHGGKKFTNYVLNGSPANSEYTSYAVSCVHSKHQHVNVGEIIMAKNSMVAWICDQRSEQLILKGMLHILTSTKNGSFSRDLIAQSQECLVVDVGSNTGFFGLLGMTFGCNALFFDVQQKCVELVTGAIEMNKFSGTGIAKLMGISDRQETLLISTESSCNGQTYVTTQAPPNDSMKKSIRLETLSSVVPSQQKILILKIDTEGNEYKVLQGALEMFRKQLILNVFVEVTACCNFWKRQGVNRSQVTAVFGTIASYGYSMWVLGESQPTGKYYMKNPFLLTTQKEISDYVQTAPYLQQDMWLFFTKLIE